MEVEDGSREIIKENELQWNNLDEDEGVSKCYQYGEEEHITVQLEYSQKLISKNKGKYWRNSNNYVYTNLWFVKYFHYLAFTMSSIFYYVYFTNKMENLKFRRLSDLPKVVWWRSLSLVLSLTLPLFSPLLSPPLLPAPTEQVSSTTNT